MADIHNPLELKVPNRTDVKELLASVIKGSATAIQSIYTYSVLDLQGESPVL